jgi:DNA mismatch repair ATPase MutL
VKVRELFVQFPVRRKTFTSSTEFEKIKKRLERIALIHPGMIFSLQPESVPNTEWNCQIFKNFNFLFRSQFYLLR